MKRIDGFKKYAIIVSILFIGSLAYDGIVCLISDDWHTVPIVLCLLLPFEAIVFVIVLLIGLLVYKITNKGKDDRQHLEV